MEIESGNNSKLKLRLSLVILVVLSNMCLKCKVSESACVWKTECLDYISIQTVQLLLENRSRHSKLQEKCIDLQVSTQASMLQTPGLELQYFSKLGLSVRQSSYYVIFNRISRAKVYSEQKVTHRTKLPQYLSRSSGSSFYKLVSTTFTAGWLSLP